TRRASDLESAAGRLARRPPVLVAHPPVAGATCGDADAAAGEAGPWEAGAGSGPVEAGPWEGGPAVAGAAVAVLRGRPRPRWRAMTTPSTKISPPHTPHRSPRRRAPAKHSALIGQRPHSRLASSTSALRSANHRSPTFGS